MKKLGVLILGAILTIGIGAGISVKPATDVAKAESSITFDLGSDGAAGNHQDGNSATSYTETVDGYTLNITGGTKMYKGAIDAKGNGCIKLGTSSAVGGFSFSVPNDVTSAIIHAGKYKSNATKMNINGTEYTLSGASNNGAYDALTVDTSAVKSVSLTTVSGGVRAMINSIEWVIGGGSGEPETPATLDRVEVRGTLNKTTYTTADANWDNSGLKVFGIYSNEQEIDHTNIASWSFSPASPKEMGTVEKGQLSITATVNEVPSKSVTYEVTVKEPETYKLVTNINQLVLGAKVVIAAANANYAISTTQNSNNRAVADIVKNSGTAELANNVQILTLEEGTIEGTYAFNTGNGYLYAASSGSNHLKTQETNDANGSWTIGIAQDGVATIKAQGANTRNWLRFNSSNTPKIFSCYGSGQDDVAIYAAEFSNTPSISINPIEDKEIYAGETGKLTVSCLNIEGTPAVAWTSSDTNVATIDATTGTYTAHNAGTTTITATVNYGGKNLTATTTLTIVKAAIIETVEIGDLLSKTEDDSTVVRVVGEVTDVSNTEYGNINIKDLDSDDEIYVYGCTLDTTKLTKTNSGDGYYKGTYSSGKNFKNACEVGDIVVLEAIFDFYETKSSPQIKGVIVDFGSDEARAFAKSASEALEEACTEYNVTTQEWAEIAADYDGLDSRVQEELADATTTHKSEIIAKWTDRYERIVTGFDYEQFMEGHIISSNYSINMFNADNTLVIISIVTFVTVFGAAALLVIKKRKYSK